jgi:hypothetical protein
MNAVREVPRPSSRPLMETRFTRTRRSLGVVPSVAPQGSRYSANEWRMRGSPASLRPR